MKDPADKKTLDLLAEQKRRGRPPAGSRSMTPAERKREQRLRQKTAVMAPESDGGKSWKDWTLQECLYVLSDPKLRKSDGLDAHKRIGELLEKQENP